MYASNGNCVECTRVKARQSAAQRLTTPDGVEKNRAKARAQYRAIAADPVAVERKRVSLRKARGMPEPTRPAPLYCECCSKRDPDERLCEDHDHVTGKFRGWICAGCNLGIGKLGDTREGVSAALAYLDRTQ